ncbi:uncharacterized protein [Haliotis asinina]|uniref:uncharacterized protein n=1 Tax=Haliotis asinina TaxID=109174 RepID=UPI0035327D5C
MFGREPRLPIDLAFGTGNNQGHESVSSYGDSLRKKLQEAYDIAAKASETAKDRQKTGYDLRVRGATVQTGDSVLVKALAFDGKHKLADRWEEDPFVVLSQPNHDIPVFVVRRETGEGRKRTLNRNHLLPIGSVPIFEAPSAPKPTPAPRSRKPAKPVTNSSNTLELEDTQDNESDEEALDIIPAVPDEDTFINEKTVDKDTSVSQTSGDDHVSVETDGNASGGDDHMQTDTEDGTEAGPEDTSEQEDSFGRESPPVPPVVVSRPTPPPRRSGRQTKRPTWQTSGEYVMCQTSDPDWHQKSRRIEQLVATVVIGHTSSCISKALLSLIDESQE